MGPDSNSRSSASSVGGFRRATMAPRDELNETLSRLGTALAKEVEAWEVKTRADRARVMDRVSQELGKALMSKEDRRAARRREREQRKAERRQRELSEASLVGGVFELLIAAAFVFFAVVRPEFWWMIFVALGVGGGGVRQLGLAAARDRELGAGQPRAEAPRELDSRAPARHEIDALCDQLLADLKASPEAVRAFVQRPEHTVEGLRKTAKALDQRRRQLAAEDAPGHLAGLTEQRRTLTSRRDAAQDAVARTKLDAALRSLDGQETALRQLVTATERVEGEYTSLLVLLQELQTRVRVARSATSAVQLGGLEQSVQRLSLELEAITESLQASDAAPFTAVDPQAAGGEAEQRDPGGRARVK